MGTISLQIPVSGALNVTEDPKISADFTTLQTLLNGNVDHNNISPTAGILASQLAAGVARMVGVAASTNVTAADGQFVLASGVGQTVTLPPVAGSATVAVMSVNVATDVTVATQGGANLNCVGQVGAGSSIVLSPGAAAIFFSDGGSWFVVSGQRDTGWVPLTLSAPFTNGFGVVPAARQQGDRVWFKGDVFAAGGDVPSATQFATLPASIGAPPSLAQMTVAYQISGAPTTNDSSGGMMVVGYTGATTIRFFGIPAWSSGTSLLLDGLSYSLT